uniref:AlNc14C1G1 protein n=1 Tax=Albugo laibachii Nc14 TaxID=890382 RepID=F0VYJ4_9STRA|nr:AlNc14C1G1 [Albugo laibachii Nc14]|eukprot:CCA13858.1 AlNc14C1G1 [Albugo laibachii Nc14]
MVSIDISSLPVTTSSIPASTSPANLPGASTSSEDTGPRHPPIPSNSALSNDKIGQSEAAMEIETPLSPVMISSNQPAAMEVDDITTSPPSNPVDQAPVTGPRPTLGDI